VLADQRFCSDNNIREDYYSTTDTTSLSDDSPACGVRGSTGQRTTLQSLAKKGARENLHVPAQGDAGFDYHMWVNYAAVTDLGTGTNDRKGSDFRIDTKNGTIFHKRHAVNQCAVLSFSHNVRISSIDLW